jgi:hypothetical protein
MSLLATVQRLHGIVIRYTRDAGAAGILARTWERPSTAPGSSVVPHRKLWGRPAVDADVATHGTNHDARSANSSQGDPRRTRVASAGGA